MSLRKAINDKCKECIYDPYAKGTWRKQVEECAAVRCPLYAHRPTPAMVDKSANLPQKPEKEDNLTPREGNHTDAGNKGVSESKNKPFLD